MVGYGHCYFELLSNADMSRQGDLDVRGNLRERMLPEWCRFFIELCKDHVTLMTRILDLVELKQRIADLVLARSGGATYANYREEVILLLHHLLSAGPVSRGEFAQVTGLAERSAHKVLAQLLEDGLLLSNSSVTELRIGFPLNALDFLFPDLWPEAATRRAID